MNSQTKIVGVEVLKRRIQADRKRGKKIAFTNGCFDIVHYGHISYLEKSKKENRILIIGLNSDKSIRAIKGKNRPVIQEKSRAALLAALMCVDYVTIFNEETPYNLIKSIKPDILIKGEDWRGKGVVGSDVVEASGGKVEYVKYVPEFSTTRIINKIYQKQIT